MLGGLSRALPGATLTIHCRPALSIYMHSYTLRLPTSFNVRPAQGLQICALLAAGKPRHISCETHNVHAWATIELATCILTQPPVQTDCPSITHASWLGMAFAFKGAANNHADLPALQRTSHAALMLKAQLRHLLYIPCALTLQRVPSAHAISRLLQSCRKQHSAAILDCWKRRTRTA